MKNRIKLSLVVIVLGFIFLSTESNSFSKANSMEITYKVRGQFLGLCIWPGDDCRIAVMR